MKLEIFTFTLIYVPLKDATIYVGGLDEKVSDSLLWELFVQAGPVVNVHMPKDRVTMLHQVSEKCAWEFGNVLKLPWVICTLSHLGWVALSKARTDRDTGSAEPGSRPIFGSVSGSENQF